MDYSQVFEISASGMRVQKTRLEVAAHNLANMHTVQTANGLPFQPLTVVSRSNTVGAAPGKFSTAMDAASLLGATVKVVPDGTAQPRLAHEPGHPQADKNGMVKYPGVNHLEQMVTITEALRAYEANIAAMQAAKSMASRALEIGGNQ
jgi:flagellar basal-body rod protein FlgC